MERVFLDYWPCAGGRKWAQKSRLAQCAGGFEGVYLIILNNQITIMPTRAWRAAWGRWPSRRGVRQWVGKLRPPGAAGGGGAENFSLKSKLPNSCSMSNSRPNKTGRCAQAELWRWWRRCARAAARSSARWARRSARRQR